MNARHASTSVTAMASRFCILCMRQSVKQQNFGCKRFYSSARQLTNTEVRQKRNAVFDEEKKRQESLIKRVEKISVHYDGVPENCKLLMNKGISTPFNCAMHINEFLMKRSVVAEVNGELWDMHRPLTEDCTINFLHMLDENPVAQNKIFWRSCSFALGHILETAFKDNIYVELCSFPPAKVEQGLFLCDANLNLPNWKPGARDLQCLSLIGGRLMHQDYEFERLEISQEVAAKMFEDNRYKTSQIPDIAEGTNGHVTVYRMGGHIDISRGPLISLSSQFGRFSVEAVYDVKTKYGEMQRIQGVALPSDIQMNWWEWELLRKKASVKVPYDQFKIGSYDQRNRKSVAVKF